MHLFQYFYLNLYLLLWSCTQLHSVSIYQVGILFICLWYVGPSVCPSFRLYVCLSVCHRAYTLTITRMSFVPTASNLHTWMHYEWVYTSWTHLVVTSKHLAPGHGVPSNVTLVYFETYCFWSKKGCAPWL